MAYHIHLQSTPTTMDAAAHFAKNGAPHLSLITASEQTKGRGRQGKVWETHKGYAFAGTFILREAIGPHLPLVASLALLKACQKVLEENVTLNSQRPTLNLSIKWPNDILKGDDKIAGILVEQRSETLALIGMGVNVVKAPDAPHTALLNEGTKPQSHFVSTLKGCMERELTLYNQHGWPHFSEEYEENCTTIGKKVRWNQSPTTAIYGQVLGLNSQGALKLQDENGVTHLVHAGEIIAQAVTS
ncbi:MAG: biotin--[acetyl-CoA-carboxylase] ligase [Alphaproteobacteria bacterium CG_4_10_14_0_8_um_filter_53_9]|nr:MAG: biotin--[acetyl-CoA-carboxylase] ligase [Alphaproteobacteria bacterium CG_4_10_14_0_8_um_filter_53_9]